MAGDFLLYGANGYTGRLIAERAVERGLRPILAGRSREPVEAEASEMDLPHRVFSLDDVQALDSALEAVPAVLHAAGPFARTSAPMAEACLRTGTHYLDITGEIGVFEALARRHGAAKEAGVMLLPGVGFDVVPSDCLAAHLARRLPGGTRLALAIAALGGELSRGTATTMIENLDRGGAVRRGGSIQSVPAVWKTRVVDFGRGPRTVTTMPWGDVSTAYHSTGIPNIEVYMRVPRLAQRLMKASRHLGWLLGASPVQALLKQAIRQGQPGPTPEERARGESLLWGEVVDEAAGRAVSRMRTPEGYTFTALSSVAVVEKVLGGTAPLGFQTPSLAFGPDFALEIEGVTREDIV